MLKLRVRRSRGETLRAIGASYGVTKVSVWHWLAGTRFPARSVLILDALRELQSASDSQSIRK